MFGGLTDGLGECDARGDGCEGATGGHCGLLLEDLDETEMITIQLLCSLS